MQIKLSVLALAVCVGGASVACGSETTDSDDSGIADPSRSEDDLTADVNGQRCPTCVWTPNLGMRTVTFGMSKAKIRETLGAPTSITQEAGVFGQDTYWHYGLTKYQVSLPALGFETLSPKLVSDKGIHVGSTKAEIQAAYPNAGCVEKSENFPAYCQLGGGDAGARVTTMVLTADNVIRRISMYILEG